MLIERLRKLDSSIRPSEDLLAFVDNLRWLRNNVMHPSDRNDIIKAGSYFQDCVLAIREMALDLKNRGVIEKLGRDDS